jgi:hypothetical protein
MSFSRRPFLEKCSPRPRDTGYSPNADLRPETEHARSEQLDNPERSYGERSLDPYALCCFVRISRPTAGKFSFLHFSTFLLELVLS